MTGGVHTNLSIVSHPKHPDQAKIYFAYSGKALVRQASDLAKHITQLKEHTRLDEYDRIKDLIRQHYASCMRSITGRGHEYAMMTAMSSLSASCN